MLGHLIKDRTSDRFLGFSYRKTLVPSKKSPVSVVIAWDVFYQESKLTQLDTLKQVKQYISAKAAQ